MDVMTDECIQKNLPKLVNVLERIATAMEEQNKLGEQIMADPKEDMISPLAAFYNIKDM